jgi:hypothetical protein
MPSSGMPLCLALVRTDVSEENNVFLIMATRIVELRKTLAVTSSGSMYLMNAFFGDVPTCVKTFFIVTAVKTSNLKKHYCFAARASY